MPLAQPLQTIVSALEQLPAVAPAPRPEDVRYITNTLSQTPSYIAQVPVAQAIATAPAVSVPAPISVYPELKRQPQAIAQQVQQPQQIASYAPAQMAQSYANAAAASISATPLADQYQAQRMQQQQIQQIQQIQDQQQQIENRHQQRTVQQQQQSGGYNQAVRQEQVKGDSQSHAAAPAPEQIAQQPVTGYEHSQLIQHLVSSDSSAQSDQSQQQKHQKSHYDQQQQQQYQQQVQNSQADQHQQQQQVSELSSFVESLPNDYQELLRHPSVFDGVNSAELPSLLNATIAAQSYDPQHVTSPQTLAQQSYQTSQQTQQLQQI